MEQGGLSPAQFMSFPSNLDGAILKLLHQILSLISHQYLTPYLLLRNPLIRSYMDRICWKLECCIGEGNSNPLQYSCLDNSIDRGAWQAVQSMGLQRVRHDWVVYKNLLLSPLHYPLGFCELIELTMCVCNVLRLLGR